MVAETVCSATTGMHLTAFGGRAFRESCARVSKHECQKLSLEKHRLNNMHVDCMKEQQRSLDRKLKMQSCCCCDCSVLRI